MNKPNVLYRALKTFKSHVCGKVQLGAEIDLPEELAKGLEANGFLEKAKIAEGSVYVGEPEEIPEIKRKPTTKKPKKGKK